MTSASKFPSDKYMRLLSCPTARRGLLNTCLHGCTPNYQALSEHLTTKEWPNLAYEEAYAASIYGNSQQSC